MFIGHIEGAEKSDGKLYMDVDCIISHINSDHVAFWKKYFTVVWCK